MGRTLPFRGGISGGHVKSEIVLGVFFEARYDGAEVFDLAEEAFDEIALSVEEVAEVGDVFPVRFRLDAAPCATGLEIMT